MTIYKCGRGFELETTENKSSKWAERDSNPGPPDCESHVLTTRPRYLVLLVYKKKIPWRPVGIELFFHVQNFLCSNNYA